MFATSLVLTAVFGRLFRGVVLRFFMTCIASVVLNVALIMIIGVNSFERKKVIAFAKKRIGDKR